MMAQTARVTLTLSNIATEEDVHNLEEKMSALTDAIAELRTTVESLTLAGRPERIAELEEALRVEREAAAALAVSEQSEDVDQNAQLSEARATVDALMAEMSAAAGDLDSITDQLNAVGTAVDSAPAGTPVDEVPVDLPPAPLPDVAPTEGDTANPTPTADPSSPTTTGDSATPDGGAPTDAGAPAPTGGPVDASGNPVDGPAL